MIESGIRKIPEKYFLAILSAAAVLRKEKLLHNLLKIARNKKMKPAKVYEALLQSYLFAGFPTALISLRIFSEYFSYKPRSETYNVKFFSARGIKNCKKVYGSKYEKLISNVNSFSPDLGEWLILEGYGKTLGRNKISLKERELCIISILTVMKFEDQLISHINGAFNCGNTKTEIHTTLKFLELIGEKSKSKWGISIFNRIRFK